MKGKGAKRRILRKDGRIQTYRIHNLKSFNKRYVKFEKKGKTFFGKMIGEMFGDYEPEMPEQKYKIEYKYLINLGFDFRDSKDNRKGTTIHGYIQFTSRYPAQKFHKGALQRLAFDLLKKQRKRAYNFNLSDESTNEEIKPHLVLMLNGNEFWNKNIENFSEEEYYYVQK
jgi:hypothetical protein